MRGLYRGVCPTLAAVAPFFATQMVTGDILKAALAKRDIEVTTPVMPPFLPSTQPYPVVLIGFTCPAMIVVIVITRALDRAHGRALGLLGS